MCKLAELACERGEIISQFTEPRVYLANINFPGEDQDVI